MSIFIGNVFVNIIPLLGSFFVMFGIKEKPLHKPIALDEVPHGYQICMASDICMLTKFAARS